MAENTGRTEAVVRDDLEDVGRAQFSRPTVLGEAVVVVLEPFDLAQ